MQDASYSLDGDGNVIVGLPPPKEGRWITARSYRLLESLVSTCLKVGRLVTTRDIFTILYR